MYIDEGICKAVAAIVLSLFCFLMLWRILGLQGKVTEGFSAGGSKKRKGTDDSGSFQEAADHHGRKARDNLHDAKAGQAEVRPEQEKQIENLDERLRTEILGHVLNKQKDKNGNWINPLLTGDDLISNQQSMALVKQLNELWRFRDTLEAAINTLDNTDATAVSVSH
jgi:hypothetical protein